MFVNVYWEMYKIEAEWKARHSNTELFTARPLSVALPASNRVNTGYECLHTEYGE